MANSPMLKTLIHALVAASLPALADGTRAAEPLRANTVLAESGLPLHFPRFDQLRRSDFEPAFEHAMADARKEVDAIASNPDKPTFDNTIVALERSGAELDRVESTFFSLNASSTNAEMQRIERTVAPKLAAHRDEVRLDPKLFSRIDALFQARETLSLDPESAHLLSRYEQDFVLAGARLSVPDKATLQALDAELATLQTTFSQNTLKEREASAVVFDRREDLAGLSDPDVAAAADAARTAGHPGQYLIELVNTTGQPVLTDLRSHAAREKIMAASLARGIHGGPFDNRATVVALARKRAERAALLGHSTYAALQLEEQTVGSVDVLNRLLAQLSPPAVANARQEAMRLQTMIDDEHGGFTLTAADWAYYSEKERKARFAFDESLLKPYHELDHVLRDGVFYAANRLYGITLKERHDLPVYDPDVRVFDVFDKDGSLLAIFIGDYYARHDKQGGAWMSEYVSQNGLTGALPVVVNNLNIPKPAAGEPTLLTQDEVVTAFHEFGHALHGMFSRVKYPRFAGAQVPRDFVEYPSQFNEMWATDPQVLKNYAKDYRTGAPIPQALLDKVAAAARLDQGFATTEYLAATLLDQAWHQLAAEQVPNAHGVAAFEAAAMHRYGVDFAPVPPRYRSAYFSHAFAGGYAAGYYSYLWSEVLADDSIDWVGRHGGLTRANGDRYRDKVLSRGSSADVLQLFRDYTGAEPAVAPYLARHGLD